ncbi:MAG: hypothetical protein ACTTIC_05285 [Helicobacteraceae bacterium]
MSSANTSQDLKRARSCARILSQKSTAQAAAKICAKPGLGSSQTPKIQNAPYLTPQSHAARKEPYE